MIYIECKPDYVLVNSVMKTSRKEVVHEFKGKFEVCKRLENAKDSKGLIDEDPSSVQPAYVQRARLETDLPEQGIKVLYDNSNNNRLIILSPRLEEWVLKAAQIAKVDVRKYDLSNDARKLHEVININLDKFEKLLEDLRESSIALKTLKGLLRK